MALVKLMMGWSSPPPLSPFCVKEDPFEKYADVAKPLFVPPLPPVLKAIAPPRKVIHITPYMGGGGLGDLKAAIALRDGIQKALPGYRAMLAVFEGDQSKLKPFVKQIGKEVLYFDKKGPPQADLTFHYPASMQAILSLFQHLLASRQAHIGLLEYGYGRSAAIGHAYLGSKTNKVGFYSLGVGENQLGMLFNKKLYRFFQRHLTPLQSLDSLNALPLKMQQALLGQAFSAQAIAAFHAQSQLYFGYSRSSVSKELFLEILAKLERQKEACVVLVGEPVDPKGNWRALQEAGVELSFYTAQDEQETPTYQNRLLASSSTPLLKMRVYSFTRLDYAVVETLLQASEKETLVTGDQSLGDSLIAGKYPINELRPHKKEISEFLSLQAVSVLHKKERAEAPICPAIAGLLTGFPLEEYEYGEASIARPYTTEDAERGAKFLRALALQDNLWREFIESLHTFDCIPKIVNLVNQYLGL